MFTCTAYIPVRRVSRQLLLRTAIATSGWLTTAVHLCCRVAQLLWNSARHGVVVGQSLDGVPNR
jgi:hypothetical protein